ncbi:MAG: TonB-dependent receptor [Bacteroidales bacterium]|nr:TonB-dependent receptor [Bacteroidales bacterium]
MRNLSNVAAFLCLIFLACANAAAQGGMVSGTVTDDRGEPQVGCAVFYDGTQEITMTDEQGKYSIPAIKGKELTFSLFGMKTFNVKIGGPRSLNVQLESDSKVLDDAVVIGYGKQLRRDLTGSVASMKADDLKKTSSNNALGALQGHVAGLNITSQSGEPGSGFQIKIRGNNSINAGTTPLFVIDGTQMEISSSEVATSGTTGNNSYDPLSFLNTNDIESIEVLKDASATAIYGAQGANGVIIITTKSGRNADRTTVSFDATLSLHQVPKRIEMLDKQEYVDYRFSRSDYGWDSYGVDTDGDGIADRPKDVSGMTNYNWQDLLYRNAFVQQYNLSASGRAGKKTQFLASLGFLKQPGLVINNDYTRYNGRLKLDNNITDNLKIGANVAFSRSITDGAVASGGGSLGNSGLIQLIYLERPVSLYSESDTDYANGFLPLTSMMSDETFKKTVYDRLIGNLYVDWTIIKGLTFRFNASGNMSSSNLKEFFSKYSRWGQTRNGYGSVTEVSTYGYNANAYLTYNTKLGDGHNLDAMIGAELSKYHYDSMQMSSYNYSEWSTGAYDIGKGGILNNPVQNVSESTRMSAFCRFNYNYKGRYYATFNFRADASSKFFKDNRTGYFPSFSLAWRPSEEPWMKEAKSWLDNLKLRLSAGTSGNDRVSTYAALATLTKTYYASMGKEIMGMAPNTSANPKLKWETTYQYNVGLDFSLFNERVDFSADVYYKDTRDMLYRAILSAQAGFTEQWQNIGRVSNKGIEISLMTRNIDKRNFSWTTNITFDLNRNQVVDIGGADYTSINMSNGTFTTDISRIMVGQPIGIGYGYVWDGNYQVSDFVIKDKYGNDFTDNPEIVTSGNLNTFKFTLKDGVTKVSSLDVQPGDRRYKDLNGDGIINAEDRTIISNSNPKFSMGFGNNFTIWNFDLSIFFEGVFGREILNEFKCRSESNATSSYFNNLQRKAFVNRWTPENASNTYSRLMNQTGTYVSSYYVEDASFVRLKTISLSYNVKSKALDRAHISVLRFTASVDNAYVFTKYSGMDPDVSSSNVLFSGFDRMSYPKARVWSLGVNLTF